MFQREYVPENPVIWASRKQIIRKVARVSLYDVHYILLSVALSSSLEPFADFFFWLSALHVRIYVQYTEKRRGGYISVDLSLFVLL